MRHIYVAYIYMPRIYIHETVLKIDLKLLTNFVKSMVEVKNDKAVPEAWSLDMAVQAEAPVPVLQSPSLAVKVTPISLDTPSGNCLTSHSYSYYYTSMELPFVAHTVTLPSMAQPWRLGRIDQGLKRRWQSCHVLPWHGKTYVFAVLRTDSTDPSSSSPSLRSVAYIVSWCCRLTVWTMGQNKLVEYRTNL